MAESVSGLAQRQHLHHHVRHRHQTPDEGEDEELDPRIQVELEKLNISSEEINRLEIQLDDARAAFRQVLSDSTQRLNGLAKKLGACVDKARPYYEARMRLKEAHLESQKAALRFERACSMHEAAKEMVQLAEEGYKRREQDLDPTWQEMLNHATMKVNDAERERMESESSHQQTTMTFKRRDDEVQRLQRDLKRMITKSRPYFEMKAKFNQVMEDHKRSVSQLEDDVSSAKALYSQALRSLEAISDDIHRTRVEKQQQRQLGERGAGVGAEAPEPHRPRGEKGVAIDGSAHVSYLEDADGNERLRSSSQERSFLKSTKMDNSGIVSHDHQYRRLASLKGKPTSETDLHVDPLNLVVFKSADQVNIPANLAKFHPPSVIHPDSERSRTSSYRAAVDGSEKQINTEAIAIGQQKPCVGTDSCYNKGVANIPSASLPEDCDYGEWSLRRAAEWVEKSPVPQHRRVTMTKSRSLVSQSGEISPIVATSMSVDLPDRAPDNIHEGDFQRSSPGSSGSLNRHSPLSTDQPSRSPKLQGLILRVDATGSVVTQSLPPSGSTPPQIITSGQQPSLSAGCFTEIHVRSASPLAELTGSTLGDTSPRPPTSLMTRSKNSPTTVTGHPRPPAPSPLSPPSPPGHLISGHHKLLSVPCSEHSSDTDSIASTGPMLDDDQVELLTLDFSETSISETSPPHRHSSQHRTSLPPNLSHLEAYLERSPGEGGNQSEESFRLKDRECRREVETLDETERQQEGDVSLSVEICLKNGSKAEGSDVEGVDSEAVQRNDIDLCSVEATVSITEDDGRLQVVELAAPLASSEELDSEDVLV